MISIGIALIIECLVLTTMCFGATYVLHASDASDYITRGIGHFYPLSSFQVSALFFLVISFLGIYLVSTSGTRGLKWFIAPVFLFCLPSIVSRSTIPEALQDKYLVELPDIGILQSDISTSSLLYICMALTAGFILVHQMVSLREMYQLLTSKGVDDYDIKTIYRARSILTVIILLFATVTGYIIFIYSSSLKTAMSGSIEFTPLISLAGGILCTVATVAVLYRILLGTRTAPEKEVATTDKRLHLKIAGDIKSAATIAIPAPVLNNLNRLCRGTVYTITKPGRYILRTRLISRLKSILIIFPR